jgi:phosphate transport system substrate-binding protein
MSSREIKPEEARSFADQGIALAYHPAAVDVLVIAVNAKNQVVSLTSKQVAAIFTGDVTDWSEVGGAPGSISVYTRNRSSVVYTDFKRLAMEGRDYPSSARFHGADPPLTSLMRDERAITYVGLAYADAPGVKVLKIDGDDPRSALRSKYPYARPNFYITLEKPSAAVQAFLQWATRSAEALELIEKTGFLPPPKP